MFVVTELDSLLDRLQLLAAPVLARLESMGVMPPIDLIVLGDWVTAARHDGAVATGGGGRRAPVLAAGPLADGVAALIGRSGAAGRGRRQSVAADRATRYLEDPAVAEELGSPPDDQFLGVPVVGGNPGRWYSATRSRIFLRAKGELRRLRRPRTSGSGFLADRSVTTQLAMEVVATATRIAVVTSITTRRMALLPTRSR